MEDKKDLLNENEALENNENIPTDDLNEELEQIARTFREELEKAQNEQTENDVTDDISPSEEPEGSEEVIFVEELCARCGERERADEYGENYEYCEECRQKMLRTPISFSSALIAVLMCAMAVISVVSFANDAEGYYQGYKAKTCKSDDMLDSALKYYDNAINYFEGEKINAKNLYLESAEVIFKTMSQGPTSMDDISDRISTALKGASSNLPMYRKSLDLRKETLTLYGTMQEFYSIVNNEKYANYIQMYDTVMVDVEALIGKELSITSIDGKTEETVIVNEGMVRFCQYMFAYSSGKIDEANEYLKKVYELEPDYLWLYAYELGIVHIKNGDYEEATKIAETILGNNKEEADGYNLQSAVARLSGNVGSAVELVDKGLQFNPANAELLRAKAMAYVAKGDVETAKTIIDEALTNNSYGLLYYTAIVIENELGNTETVNEMISIVENGGLTLSARMQSYLNGKITAKQMFTEGTGDVE